MPEPGSAGNQSSGPLPLVLGITGHRDLREQDGPRLEAAVTDIIGGLAKRYPHTPLTLLSPLAEGADRLAARIALRHGARLVVPLPMPRDLYEDDFESEASRAEFAELLAAAGQCFTLPLMSPAEEVRRGGEARERQYEQVGAYIALHSQILIALWDGAFTKLRGGTAEVITFQLQGVPEPYAKQLSPLDIVETGPVCHVVTPRAKNPEPPAGAFEVRSLYPRGIYVNSTDEEGDEPAAEMDGDAAARHYYDGIFEHLEVFNRDAVQHEWRLADERASSRTWFLPEDRLTALPADLALIVENYLTADTLAIHFARRTRRALILLLSLAFLAAVCIDLYGHVEEWRPALLLYLYPLVLLGGALFWLFRVKRPEIQKKYLDYRALAEGLRVQCYWHLVGIRDSVAGHYLRRQKSELDWIRNGIRATDVALGPFHSAGSPVETSPEDYQLVLRYWVEEQHRFFENRTQRDRRKRKAVELRVRGLFILGGLAGVALALLVAIENYAGIGFDLPDRAWEVLLILSTLTLVAAALNEGYADKMAFGEQARQYQRMRVLYERVAIHVRQALAEGRIEDARAALLDLGREALAENGDWVVLHRGRPVEMVKGV
jgi:hypothetical protein